MVLHCLQLHPHTPYRDHELKKYLRLSAGDLDVFSYKVVGGRTMEVCLAQYWSSLGECTARLSLNFHGITPSASRLTIHGGESFTQVTLSSQLRDETVAPKLKVDTWQQKVRPDPALTTLRPMGERDLLPKNRQVFQLVLTYTITQEADGDVTPRFPTLNGVLYESAYMAQMYMIFDSDKKLLGCGDAWPEKCKVPKGKATVKIVVRHERVELLQGLKSMLLLLERSLSCGDKFGLYPTLSAAVTGGGKFRPTKLRTGQACALFVAEPSASDLVSLTPAGAKPGDVLLGSITYGQKREALAGGGFMPGGYPFAYVLPPVMPEEKKAVGKPKAKEGEAKKEEGTSLADEIRDLKVKRLVSYEGKKDEYDSLFKQVVVEFPMHLPLLLSKLHHTEKLESSSWSDKVDAAADVLALIDQEEMAKHFGMRLLPDNKEDKDLRKEMDTRKEQLVEALTCKAMALAAHNREEGAANGGEAGTTSEARVQFDQTYALLQRWTDTADVKHAKVYLEAEKVSRRLGNVLRKLTKFKGGDKLPDGMTMAQVQERRIEIMRQLGWKHWADHEEKWKVLARPDGYPLF
jgi:tripeptidyl-peptidase-2